MSRYADLAARGQARWGDKWDEGALEPDFVRWYESGDRVKVRYTSPDGTYTADAYGTIGATTGWRPAFLLIRSVNARGSSYVIGPHDRVVAVKRGRKYVEAPR